jgi:hypothetical protein
VSVFGISEECNPGRWAEWRTLIMSQDGLWKIGCLVANCGVLHLYVAASVV